MHSAAPEMFRDKHFQRTEFPRLCRILFYFIGVMDAWDKVRFKLFEQTYLL